MTAIDVSGPTHEQTRARYPDATALAAHSEREHNGGSRPRRTRSTGQASNERQRLAG